MPSPPHCIPTTESPLIEQGSHSDWKTWKMGRHFPVREKSGNFEQTGKVRENHTKYWKTQGIRNKYYLIFSMIFK